jgi:hypothetical protein
MCIQDSDSRLYLCLLKPCGSHRCEVDVGEGLGL